MRISNFAAGMAVAIAAMTTSTAFAQSYPVRSVRVVVPYPPGGGGDNAARAYMTNLSDVLGQQLVIDNRGGAGGTIGAELVAKSKPDGYTLLSCGSSHAIADSLYKLNYYTIKDFAPIGQVMLSPNIVVVSPSLPVNNVNDLINLARQRPGQISFASAGIGSAPHMAGELINYMAKIKMVHVPYKGGAQVFTDLMGGQIQLYIPTMASGLVYVKGGKLRGIAITSARRSRLAPDIPTLSESGLPGFDISEWNGVWAPAGTPTDVVTKLNGAMRKVLAMPEVEQRFAQMGAEVTPGTPEQLEEFMRSEVAKWKKDVPLIGIKAE